MCFISVYSVLNTISEYKYFYISKNIPSYTLLLVCKIVESLQCMLKRPDAFFLIARGYRGYNVIVRNSFSSKHKHFLIIVSKIIWFWSTFDKKARVNYNVTRKYRVSKFLQPWCKNRKTKGIGLYWAGHYLEFLSSKSGFFWAFSKGSYF